MVWRSVVINQPARLKREHFALLVEQDQAARVPFEDIAVIVLNHREIARLYLQEAQQILDGFRVVWISLAR